MPRPFVGGSPAVQATAGTNLVIEGNNAFAMYGLTLRNPNATSMSLTFKALDIYGKTLLTQTITLAAGQVLDAFGAGYFDGFDPITKIEWTSQGEIIDNLMVRRYPELEVASSSARNLIRSTELPTITLTGNNTINAFGRIINDATGRDVLENYTLVNAPAGQVEITIYANLVLAANAVLKPAANMDRLLDIKVIGDVTLLEGATIDVSAIGTNGIAGGGEGGLGGTGGQGGSGYQLPAFQPGGVIASSNTGYTFWRMPGQWGGQGGSGGQGTSGLYELSNNVVFGGNGMGISQGANALVPSVLPYSNAGVFSYSGSDNRLTPGNALGGGLRGGDGASGAGGGSGGTSGYGTILTRSNDIYTVLAEFAVGGVGGTASTALQAAAAAAVCASRLRVC